MSSVQIHPHCDQTLNTVNSKKYGQWYEWQSDRQFGVHIAHSSCITTLTQMSSNGSSGTWSALSEGELVVRLMHQDSYRGLRSWYCSDCSGSDWLYTQEKLIRDWSQSQCCHSQLGFFTPQCQEKDKKKPSEPVYYRHKQNSLIWNTVHMKHRGDLQLSSLEFWVNICFVNEVTV